MHSLTIRRATAKDATELSALVQRCVRILNAPDYAPQIIDLICENFSVANVLAKMQDRDVFVGESGSRAVGTVSFGGKRLHSLFVEPEFKGRGIGKALVTYLERHALGKGVKNIELSSSLTARQFYRGLGYDEIVFEERRDGSTVLMRKQLA